MPKLTAQLLSDHKGQSFVARTLYETFTVTQTRRAGNPYELVVEGDVLFMEVHVVVHLNVIFWLIEKLYHTQGAEEAEWINVNDLREGAIKEQIPLIG